MPTPTNLEVLTPIWKTSGPTFQDRIPAPSKAQWNTIKTMIASDDYLAERNQIADALVNLIAMQKVIHRSLHNPLAQFRRGEIVYGDTLQEITTDVIAAEHFNIGEDDPFEKRASRVEAVYHKINREDMYRVTLEDTHLIRAFRNEGGLSALQDSIINQMYNSDALDEWIYTRRMFWEFYNHTGIPLRNTQVLLVPDPSSNLLDKSIMEAFTMCVRGAIKQLTYFRREYNNLGLMQQSQPDNLTLFLKADVMVGQEVQVVANAFHPEYADVQVPITAIDHFGEPGSAFDNRVVGIIADNRWLSILDNLRTTRFIENPRNLYRNYFYHHHQVFATSPLHPVIYLLSDPLIPDGGPYPGTAQPVAVVPPLSNTP